jgi:N-acetylglucosaminyldiphosphoundecaprenol N-acetyl-beta-D-mannosaminyltransferase
MSRISLLDLPIDTLTFRETIARCDQLIDTPAFSWAVTLNPEIAVFAHRDIQLKKAIQEASLVTADGNGIIWGANRLSKKASTNFLTRWLKTFTTLIYFLFSSKFRRKIFPERVAGVDLTKTLFALAAKKGYRIFLLGGKEGVAQALKEKLEAKYPAIRIVGATAGFRLRMEKNQLVVLEPNKELEVVHSIRKTEPHLLFVAFGPPKQERWVYQNQKRLLGVRLAIGVGGTFDFLTGSVKRAPLWVQRLGLEFLWRLVLGPKRFKRMFKTIPLFIRLVSRYQS